MKYIIGQVIKKNNPIPKISNKVFTELQTIAKQIQDNEKLFQKIVGWTDGNVHLSKNTLHDYPNEYIIKYIIDKSRSNNLHRRRFKMPIFL